MVRRNHAADGGAQDGARGSIDTNIFGARDGAAPRDIRATKSPLFGLSHTLGWPTLLLANAAQGVVRLP